MTLVKVCDATVLTGHARVYVYADDVLNIPMVVDEIDIADYILDYVRRLGKQVAWLEYNNGLTAALEVESAYDEYRKQFPYSIRTTLNYVYYRCRAYQYAEIGGF